MLFQSPAGWLLKTSGYIINSFYDLRALSVRQRKLLGDLKPSVISKHTISHCFLSFFTSLPLLFLPHSPLPLLFYLTFAFPTSTFTPLPPPFSPYILVSFLSSFFLFSFLSSFNIVLFPPQSPFLTCYFLFLPPSFSSLLPSLLSYPLISYIFTFSFHPCGGLLPTISFPLLTSFTVPAAHFVD